MTGLKEIEEEDHKIWLERYMQEKGVISTLNMVWKIAYKLGMHNANSNGFKYECKCPAIAFLSTKDNLNHRERTALMMIYLNLNDEKRLWEILEKQKNFNERICSAQIKAYKKNGLLKGISCEKLIEWHICNDGYSDCRHFQEARNDKPS